MAKYFPQLQNMRQRALTLLSIAARERGDDSDLMHIIAELSSSLRERLMRNGKIDPILIASLSLYAVADRAIAKRLISRDDASSMFSTAVAKGDLKMAKKLDEAFKFKKTETFQDYVPSNVEDYTEEAEYVYSSLLGLAAANGSLDMAKWITARYGYTRGDVLQSGVYAQALEGGNLELLIWLEKTFKLERGDLDVAYLLGTVLVYQEVDTDTAWWFLDRFGVGPEELIKSDVLAGACQNDRSDILDWLSRNVKLSREDIISIFVCACLNGQLDFAKDIYGRHKLEPSEMLRGREIANRWSQGEVVDWLNTCIPS